MLDMKVDTGEDWSRAAGISANSGLLSLLQLLADSSKKKRQHANDAKVTQMRICGSGAVC
jgi:hypothetical protein